MKKFALILAVIFAVGIIAPAFAENTSANGRIVTNKQVQALQEKYRNIQEQYLAAKQQYQAAKENYTSAKSDWESARKAFLEKRNDTNATAAMIEKGKTYLTNTVDNRIKHLELIKSKVENMSVLSDAEKSSIIAELNANIAAFEAFKPEIAAVTTKEGLKAVAEKIKEEWINSRRGVEWAVGRVLAEKESKLAELAEKVSFQAKTRLGKLKASGKDTSAYDAVLSEFDAGIASAKSDIDAAKEKFNAVGSASTRDEKEALINEGKDLLKSAHEKIKEAHKLLKEAVKNAASKIKETRKEVKDARKDKNNVTREDNDTPPALP